MVTWLTHSKKQMISLAMEETQQKPHVVLVPGPGMGHLIPFIEFSKKLVFDHDFLVTFLIPTLTSPSNAILELFDSLPESISYNFLSVVNLDDLESDTHMVTRFAYLFTRSLHLIRDALKKMVVNSRVVALVADVFAVDVFDVAIEFKLSPYILIPASATFLSLCLEMPELDKSCTCEYQDLLEPVRLPGCVPLRGSDLFDPVKDRKNEAYSWILHHCEKYRLAEGIFVNSFIELEPDVFKALTKVSPDRPPVYPVGPLTRSGGEKFDSDRCECLRWLDDQPHGSVLFISFGSNGTLSREQLTELAFGLEMSNQRFLWAIRSPNDEVIDLKTRRGSLDVLPKGFLDRTKGLGLVVVDWVPQVQVLSHGSTAGFLTHCGWNSTLESVAHGVPLIAWPLFAEQKMNAAMLDGIKVAVRPICDENDIVRRGEIAKSVKTLMEEEEGKKLRSKMEDLMRAAVTVLGEEGSSTKSLNKVVLKLKHQI